MALNVTFIPNADQGLSGIPIVKLTNGNIGERVALGSDSTAASGRGVFRVTAAEDTHITISAAAGTAPTGTTGTLIPAGVTDYFACAEDDVVHTATPT